MKNLLPIGIILFVVGALLALFNQSQVAYPTYITIAGVAAIALYVVTNLQEMAKRSTMYGMNAVLMSAFMVVILVVIYMIAQNRDTTWDFSATGKYTVDPQTAKILEGLDAPVKMLLFFPTNARASSEFNQIQTLMDEYVKRTDKISYELIDASKDYETAVKYAKEISNPLQPTIVAEAVVDEKPIREKATGLKQEDITNAIMKVTHREKKIAYFLVGHYERELESTSPVGMANLKNFLDDENIQASPLRLGAAAEIPEDADLIAIVGPEEDLSEVEVGALRRFVTEGGALFVGIDPQSAPRLGQMLASFGIVVGQNMVIQMVVGAASLEAMLAGQYTARPSDTVEVDKFDAAHEITKELKQGAVTMLQARGVDKVPSPPEGVTLTNLAYSPGGKLRGSEYPSAWAESEPNSLRTATSMEGLFDAATDKEGPISLAVAAQIDLAVFAGGTPDPENPEKKGKVVVVGDSDFLTDGGMTKDGGLSRGHLNLALNIFNWLAGQVDLITIREPELDNTSVTLSAEEKGLVRNLFVVAIPFFFIPAIGIGVGIYRRMKYV